MKQKALQCNLWPQQQYYNGGNQHCWMGQQGKRHHAQITVFWPLSFLPKLFQLYNMSKPQMLHGQTIP
eukprot:3389426-Ditylum_brightwellii.AAC.1